MAAFGVGVGAGQQAPLTLDDCQRLALAAPSTLSLARQDREIASRGIIQARSAFLPYTQVNSGFNYNSPVAGEPSFIAANGVHEYVAQVAIMQEFDTSGRLRSDLARARAE
jgi:outer membrane protein TolC